jgi:hypothetical protein
MQKKKFARITGESPGWRFKNTFEICFQQIFRNYMVQLDDFILEYYNRVAETGTTETHCIVRCMSYDFA